MTEKLIKKNISPLFEKYGIDINKTPFISETELNFDFNEKELILTKLLEAHELALINVLAGNITGRGFATNACTYDGYWSIGTNFNNTRNDISSICGERGAILSAYNDALIRFSKDTSKQFVFKIKYLCMAQSVEFQKMTTTAVPCEDCLSWLNTNRCFDDNTTIFSFEKNDENGVFIRGTKLCELLPYKDFITSNLYYEGKKIYFSDNAKQISKEKNISSEKILDLVEKTYQAYKQNQFTKISNQNIACSILTNNQIYTTAKNDWTKRWYVEPLEASCYAAVKNEDEVKINAICYFGDEYSTNGEVKYLDKIVSIKALGRIRQKFATNSTLLILNFDKEILVITLGEYLPKKFIQGYKIK